MNTDDKEFLLSILDDMVVYMLTQDPEKTKADIFSRLTKAITIVERSCFEHDAKEREVLDFEKDWHSELDY